MTGNELKGLVDYLASIGYRLVEFNYTKLVIGNEDDTREVYDYPLKFSVEPERIIEKRQGESSR